MINFFTSNIWNGYLSFFSIFAKSVWFFYYSALYIFDKKQDYPEYKGKTCLIVPIYNEDEVNLQDTIYHIKKAKGINQIIFINDGSTNNTINILKNYNDGFCKVIDLKKNMGKREAQARGIEEADEDTEVFVFADSDTILQENSIIELTRPMNDPNIGGATACILVRNKKTNFLTRCVSAMYWTASNIWRQAQSNLGFTQVTNGQLSCYRADLIRKLLPDYTNQIFMGKRCTLSDDRYLTHNIQTRFRKKIVFADKSIAYTYIPETLRKTYKMFLRWKIGSFREAFLVLRKAKKNPLLAFDVWANHLIAIMQTIVRIGIIIMAFFYPPILLYYLAVIIVISLLFSLHMVFFNIKEIFFKVCYSIMNEIFFGWVYIHALIKIRNQNIWSTR